jgi:hypothetical protein
MSKPWILIAVFTGVLVLGACDKTPRAPPSPVVSAAVPAESAAAAGSVADPSVPPAGAVFAPANAAKIDPPQGRSNTAMSAAQESTAMPMPGQSNDHSAPLGPAKRASAP